MAWHFFTNFTKINRIRPNHRPQFPYPNAFDTTFASIPSARHHQLALFQLFHLILSLRLERMAGCQQ
ncbi:hypothetical protein PGT21_002937 [Puccinia graminis f. sp. tritici]|uniref:Uncharacterized protein n=1 Tax=Puccinia graminis f. sp. tritici TaxID=56615 RepID=A0A5B0PVR3_PUCGR|nr:hypothetical protein PGT21_002937 [Puccinia graminis f. sp. tritici]KAA1105136.1 hypothetical protein PGTUg99_016413 [Puccinia graminis f. sp. tritici]